jgi:hypothetical protein
MTVLIHSDEVTSLYFEQDGITVTGKHESIVVNSGTVNIEDIYENDVVTGVTTKRGADKGLNLGAGSYDPENGAFIDCIDFTISSGATLTHGTAMGTGASNKNGIVFIGCLRKFTNEGTVNVDELGYEGGDPFNSGSGQADNGLGPGGGEGGYRYSPYNGGAGGSSYGSSDIPLTTWSHLYGSGGGGGVRGATATAPGGAGGGGGHAASGSAGENNYAAASVVIGNAYDGGWGGGAVRIYAQIVDNSSGTISADGEYPQSDCADQHSQPGSGAGGTVYIATKGIATLGTDNVTAVGGASWPRCGVAPNEYCTAGGAGSVGRIHVEGDYTGSTSSPAIA